MPGAVATAPPELESLRDEDLRPAIEDLDDEPDLLAAVEARLPGAAERLHAGICLEASKFGAGPEDPAVRAVATAIQLLHAVASARDDPAAALAGVWLVGRAVELASQCSAAALAGVIAAREDAVEGLMMDREDLLLTDRSRERWMQVAEKKTSSLFSAAVALGAQTAGADDDVVATLRRFGHHLGIAVQIADEAVELVEPGDDLRVGLYTLPVVHACELDASLPALLPQATTDESAVGEIVAGVRRSGGIEAAIGDAREHADLARAALAELRSDPDGARERLEAVVDHSLGRIS